MKKLNQDLGWYWPSSLCIHLVEEPIRSGKLLNLSAPLFHEYIHFLQDISTWMGCFNFVHHCNSLKLLQRYFKVPPDSVFSQILEKFHDGQEDPLTLEKIS